MAENPGSLGRALRGMFVKPTIDETTWEDLETALLTADFTRVRISLASTGLVT